MAGARVFRVEFRIAIARRILNGESASALSKELKIKRSVLYRWRDAYRDQGVVGLSLSKGRPPGATTKAISEPNAGAVAADQKIAELERRLGRMALVWFPDKPDANCQTINLIVDKRCCSPYKFFELLIS